MVHCFKDADRSPMVAGGVYVAIHYLPGPEPSSAKVAAPEVRPKVDVVHPRRAKLAQRLVSNATLEALEETDLFAKVSGYLSEVRVDIVLSQTTWYLQSQTVWLPRLYASIQPIYTGNAAIPSA